MTFSESNTHIYVCIECIYIYLLHSTLSVGTPVRGTRTPNHKPIIQCTTPGEGQINLHYYWFKVSSNFTFMTTLDSDRQPLSTKRTSISHFKSLNTKRTTIYTDGKQCSGLRQALNICCGVKSVQRIPSLPSFKQCLTTKTLNSSTCQYNYSHYTESSL